MPSQWCELPHGETETKQVPFPKFILSIIPSSINYYWHKIDFSIARMILILLEEFLFNFTLQGNL